MHWSLLHIFWAFLKLGCYSFGGPIAHIGYFRHQFVVNSKWVTDAQFTNSLALCQFLPGPASSQLGFILGMHRGGLSGAVAAFLGFTLPSVIMMFVFAWSLNWWSEALLDIIITALKWVAVIVVFDAIKGMSKSILTRPLFIVVALLSAIVLIVFGSAWLQLLVLFAAGLLGYVLHIEFKHPEYASLANLTGPRSAVVVLSVCTFSCVLLFVLKPELLYFAISFLKAGFLVFGGGHVVVPLLESSVVAKGYVTQEMFIAGYGAAQAVPGPMFTVSVFLGAVADLPYQSTHLALIALLSLFTPGFLLLVLVIPWWQRLGSYPKAAGAISTVNASVVGVLTAAFVNPIATSALSSWRDVAVVFLGVVVLTVFRRNPLWVIAFCIVMSGLAHLMPN